MDNASETLRGPDSALVAHIPGPNNNDGDNSNSNGNGSIDNSDNGNVLT